MFLYYMNCKQKKKMNKKGLILIFLFVVASVGVVALTNAKTSDNKVDVTLRYYPNSYVDMGYLWVEFDERILDDNMVFGQDDVIHFAFYYDVPVITWASQSQVPGNGWQTDEWFYCPPNNWTAGYQGTDIYNCTRYAGMLNVMLDDYDLGMSNFDISASTAANTYQDISLSLDVGWHFLTVIAAELDSDGNHTTWEWNFVKDQIKFYVGETKDDVPNLIEDARNNFVHVNATPVESADLNQNFSWTSFYDFMHPVAEPASDAYFSQEYIEEGGTPAVANVEVQYNATDMPLGLVSGPYGSMFASIFQMGPSNYTWFVNDGNMYFGDDFDIALSKGSNYVWFIVFGFKSDDYSLVYGNPSPAMAADTAVFRVNVGVVTQTGMGFGILISVSMLGLVSALILRRRK